MLSSISESFSLGRLGYNDSTVSSVAIDASTSKISPCLVSLSALLNKVHT